MTSYEDSAPSLFGCFSLSSIAEKSRIVNRTLWLLTGLATLGAVTVFVSSNSLDSRNTEIRRLRERLEDAREQVASLSDRNKGLRTMYRQDLAQVANASDASLEAESPPSCRSRSTAPHSEELAVRGILFNEDYDDEYYTDEYYTDESYKGDSYNSESNNSESNNGESYNGESYKGESYNGESYNGESYNDPGARNNGGTGRVTSRGAPCG
jgi:hypothetical protein